MERTHQSGNRNGSLIRPETRSGATSSDFVLQWGNRKRLRCMKNNDPSGSGQGQRRRVGRRVVRSGRNLSKDEPNSNQLLAGSSGGKRNGHLDIHQTRILSKYCGERVGLMWRPEGQNMLATFQSYPPNSESSFGMRSNGVDKKGGVTINNNNSTHLNNTSNKNNNNDNHHLSGSGSGGSGSSSGSGDAIAATWPPKFVIALTNKEKEEDFMLLKGSKLPQRPKKRAKFIQRTLNLVSPGTWLCDLTLERYEVREKKATKKRPRGLKGMGNCVDSDSE